MEIRLCSACSRWCPQGVTRCPRCGSAITLADESALVGMQLGRYRLTGVIGAGGMGIVFAAVHVGLGREVAIKALLPGLDHDDMVARFTREARLLATLVHPHIVGVFDVDVADNGLPFYVMERLHGMSLGTALARVGRPLGLAELAPVFIGIARALDHAHRQQIVHRDLKPENIFLEQTATGAVAKLLDFGIAKQIGGDADRSRLTQTGAVLGTPMYLSPEQLADEPLGPASDQFTLALILVECLTGLPVRDGQSPTRMLRQAMQGEVVDAETWARLPASARPALARALAFAPDARFPDCSTFLDGLGIQDGDADDAWIRALGLGEARQVPTPMPPTTDRAAAAPASGPATVPTPAPATRVGTFPPGPKPGRRRVASALAALALVLAGGGWFWWLRTPDGAVAPDTWPDPASHPTEVGQREVPTDAGLLVGAGDGTAAAFAGRGGLLLLPLDGAAPSRRNIDGRLVGTTQLGELVTLEGAELVAADPQGKRARKLGDVPATAAWIRVDRAAEWVAYAEGGALHWFATDDSGRRGRHDLGTTSVAGLALAGGQAALVRNNPARLDVFALATGELLLSRPHDQGRVHDVAFDPERGRIALCGFSPQVEVFTIGRDLPPERIPVASQCNAAAWLPDGPTLLLRADRQIVAWRDGLRRELAWAGDLVGPDGDLPRMVRANGVVWLHEPDLRTLTGFTVGPARWPALNDAAGAESWDLAVDSDRVYVGLSNGTLLAIGADGTRALKVHDAGITDIVDGGDAIATASDDRTVAVWRKPGLDVAWRSRSHDFLVNQLWLSPDRSHLWTSSSDGRMKQWRWPDLTAITEVDARTLRDDPSLSLHAIWLDAREQRAIAGTWNRQVLRLQRGDDGWSATTVPVPAAGGYRLLELPGHDAVLLLTVRPSRLFVFDLRAPDAAPLQLPDFGLDLLALAEGPGDGHAIAAGDGAVVLLSVVRDGTGRLIHRGDVRQIPALGVVHSAAFDRPKDRVLVANHDGVVFALARSLLVFPEPESR